MIRYQIFHNVSARFMRGAVPGDVLIRGWEGTLDVSPEGSAFEAVFRQHNRDSRPDGRQAPSLSVGDVVVIIGVGSRTVDSMGWSDFDISTAGGIHDGPYCYVIEGIQMGLIERGLL